MSDYKYVKVIRYRNPLLLGELLPNYIYGANNYQDLIDYIMKTHPEYSENPKYKKFKLGFDRDNDYIGKNVENGITQRDLLMRNLKNIRSCFLSF